MLRVTKSITLGVAALSLAAFALSPDHMATAANPQTAGMAPGSGATKGQAAAPAANKAGASTAAPAATTGNAFKYGCALYQQGRYNQAIQYFHDSINKENGTATSWLYLAHCFYASGQRNKALTTYHRIVELFGNTQEAVVAKQSLQRLDPKNEWKDGAEPEQVDPDEAAWQKLKATPLKDRLEIVRGKVGHPAVSEALIKKIKACLDGLPPDVQALLMKRGVRFCLTPTMIDKFPAGAYQEVPGYDGGTTKSCPGCFDNGLVCIAESTVDENTDDVKPPRLMDAITKTFYHETGHALDYCLRRVSNTDEYKHNYLLDIARVPDDVANRIKYFLQKSTRGQSEACAELLAIQMGSERETSADMKEVFKNTAKFLAAKVKTGGDQAKSK